LSYSRGKPAQEGNKKPAEDAKPTKIGGLKEKIRAQRAMLKRGDLKELLAYAAMRHQQKGGQS